MTAATKLQPRERPILFSSEMVMAILAGRKTQTRRIVQLPFAKDTSVMVHARKTGPAELTCSCSHLSDPVPVEKVVRPRWAVGEMLWVKETWATVFDCPELPCECEEGGTKHRRIVYRATEPDGTEDYVPWGGGEDDRVPWRPSLFMRREHSRITLEVAGVRVECLDEISEEDAKAEGAAWRISDGGDLAGAFEDCDAPINYRAHFRDLWERINGEGSWDANPFVWVVTFRRVKP